MKHVAGSIHGVKVKARSARWYHGWVGLPKTRGELIFFVGLFGTAITAGLLVR